MFFRLCSVAPSTRSFCPVGLRRVAGTGIARSSRRYLPGERSRILAQALERTGIDDTATEFAGAEPHVDDLVGHGDHVGVVLDDQHGVALVAQLPEDADEAQVVARVQADGRFVEHVQRADERRPERRRQADALRLAA